MARTWAILSRVLLVPVPVLAPGDAPAGGEGEAESEAQRDAEAHAVAEAVEAGDAQAGGDLGEAAAQPGADFSISLAEPPRITVMIAAPTAHPFPEYPDTHPYIVCVDSDCILLNFGVQPFKGACFDDRPYHSNLMVVRDYNRAGVEQDLPITATAERIPPRDGGHAIVSNVESIGLIVYGLEPEEYVIAELMINKGMDRAMLVYYYAGLHSKWIQESTDNPLPWLQERNREWLPSGVVPYNKMLWWFDLSWGIISYDPMLETTEPLLLFHRLPLGQDLKKAQRVHDRRCIAVSQGALRYVAITPDGADAATVSMWTRVASALVRDGSVNGWVWEEEFTVSFAEIWDHDSYTDTGLPRKVPVLVAVCPSNANMVYFALEDPKRLFGVNMYSRRVEEFVNESYELLTPGPEAPPSCRYVLPWFLPLEFEQALGESGDAEDEELIDEEELKEAGGCQNEEKQPETEEDEQSDSEPEVQSKYDLMKALADVLGVEQPVVVEELPEIKDSELPEIKDSELPVDESSSDEGLIMAAVMDPATIARLRSEVKEDRLEYELEEKKRQSGNPPGPGDDAGEGAF